MATRTIKQQKARVNNLMPQGLPKYVRVYDNGGESADRYTVVFTGRYRHKTLGECTYLAMSGSPYHPQGVGLHGSSGDTPDTNEWGYAPALGRKCHLGTRIKFEDLPGDCQHLVLTDYTDLWDLPIKEVFSHYWTQAQFHLREYSNRRSFPPYSLSFTLGYDFQRGGNYGTEFDYQSKDEAKKAARTLYRNQKRLKWMKVLGLIILKNY